MKNAVKTVCCSFLLLCLLMENGLASLSALPMNRSVVGPEPRDANYVSSSVYKDESIQVKVLSGVYAGVPYNCAWVKIRHASQLRTVSAQYARNPRSDFNEYNNSTARGVEIAQAVNAVVGMNGDYYINPDKCQVVLRQGKQMRNRATGQFDVLVIDRNGDFSALRNCTANDYKAYYKAHSKDMYQVMCFGPVLVQNGASVISPKFNNREMISQEKTQRAAIAQLGPLEYMLITSDGDAINYTYGLTIPEFASLCEVLGKRIRKTGFMMAYNLDGGNSSTLVFKRRDTKNGGMKYVKLNQIGRGRQLSDMICFLTLVQ